MLELVVLVVLGAPVEIYLFFILMNFHIKESFWQLFYFSDRKDEILESQQGHYFIILKILYSIKMQQKLISAFVLLFIVAK